MADPQESWLEVRDRVTGKLLCQYNPETGEIRVRRGSRVYLARLPRPVRPGRPPSRPGER